MISRRLIRMGSCITTLARSCGTVPFYFDADRILFSMSNLRSHYIRIRVNFGLILFWGLASLASILKLYLQGDKNKLHLTTAYLFAGSCPMAIYSLFVIFQIETCTLLNGIIHYLLYLHSKPLMQKISNSRVVEL